MNVRTQIKLDPETQRRAHAKAAELGISFADYVRRLVAQDLGPPKRKAPISAIFDLGASAEPTDVARDKHKMLDEAAWEEYERKTSTSTRRTVRSRSPKAPKR
jgi:hypothetical protein